MNNLYKRTCEKKIDILEEVILNIEQKELVKKDIVCQIVYVCVCIIIGVVFNFYYQNQLQENYRNIYMIGMVLMMWMATWVGIYTMYSLVKEEQVSEKIRVILEIFAYIAFIGGVFIACIMSVFEILSTKIKIVEIYKYFLEVLCSASVASLWAVLISDSIFRVVESRYKDLYEKFDWDFLTWIIFFIIMSCLYRFILSIQLRISTKNQARAIKEKIYYESRIPFYSILVFSMIAIWGRNLESSYEGYINASTVWVLMGAIMDRMVEKK